MPKTHAGWRCWCRLRQHGHADWSAGCPGHCGVWGYSDPVHALLGARRLHKLTAGSRRSGGAPDATAARSAISGLNPQHAWIDEIPEVFPLDAEKKRRRTDHK
jgi:hypothetical protein